MDDHSTSDLFSELTFDNIDLPAPLREAVDEQKFVHLTQVQAAVLPIALAGGDVVAQAQTGSGKTAAYLLALFTHFLRTPRSSPPEVPRALIVAPTRELAVQIARDAEMLGSHTNFGVHVVFGGVQYRKQRQVLEQGTDLLIGTPGRLIDYNKQGAYSLKQTEIVIIDECDRLFDMGFADDLRWIMQRLPQPNRRQSMMFSATLSRRVMTIGLYYMNQPEKIVINPQQLTPDTISQVLYHVSTREKLSLLLGVLKSEASTRTMVFVNTRHWARRLVEELQRHGYNAHGLTGSVIQTRRLRVLDDFREGRLPILVATDVASRGLHIDGVSHVINYDLPQDPEDYVHRIGRTARAGAEGKAITLCCDHYVYSLAAVQRLMGYEIPVSFAGDELFHKLLPPGQHSRQGRSRQRPAKPQETEAAAEKPRRRRRRKKPSQEIQSQQQTQSQADDQPPEKE